MMPFLHRVASPAADENPLWLVVLADMMTNLMLFFLVMFALSQQSQEAREQMVRTFDASNLVDRRPQSDAEIRKLEFLERQSVESLRKLFSDVEVTQDIIRVRLQNQALFSSGRASLSPASDQTIIDLAKVLKEMPNTVIIEGHTDNVPLANSPYKSNWELSVARSYSVIERLRACGIQSARLVAAGYGEHHPAASNDTAAGRMRNRRVEILILRGVDEGDAR